jgi:hypothetical protein
MLFYLSSYFFQEFLLMYPVNLLHYAIFLPKYKFVVILASYSPSIEWRYLYSNFSCCCVNHSWLLHSVSWWPSVDDDHLIFNQHQLVICKQDGDNMFLWNIGIYIQVHTVLQPRQPTSTCSLLWKPSVSCYTVGTTWLGVIDDTKISLNL